MDHRLSLALGGADIPENRWPQPLAGPWNAHDKDRLEIELWQIADSLPAPKFNVVSKPNDWTAVVSGAARGITNAALTPNRELQREYWEAFRQELLRRSSLRPPRALPQYGMYLSIGRSGLQLMAAVSSREPWIQSAFTFSESKRDAQWFPLLLQQRDED